MSSIFASRVPKTLEIPFDPPHTVTIKRLSGKHLAQAALENQLNSIDTFRKMGGAKFQRELNEIRSEPTTDTPPPAAPNAPDPLAGYDRYVLMARGIVSWTYPESLTPEVVHDDESEKKTRMAIPAIEDLTDEAAEFFAREILRLSKPSLFVTEAEAEAAQKNDSSASIVA